MFARNTVFEDPHGTRFRLLDIDGPKAHVFCLSNKKALPRQWLCSELTEGAKSGHYKLVRGVNAPASLQESDASRVLKKERKALIEELVINPAIYYRKTRGPLVAETAAKTGKTQATIMACLRLYWAGGMTWDALVPRFHLCGIEQSSDSKPLDPDTAPVPRGRKPDNDRYQKFAMTPATAKKIKAYVKTLWKKKNTGTYAFIYREVVRHFYSYQDADGRLKQLGKGERPTRAQIDYMLRKQLTVEEQLRRKHTDAGYENNHKPMTGSVLQDCIGIGHYFEIDATIVDVFLVARDSPDTVIGKATLYLVIDRYSRLIVGFHLTLDKPSWAGAMEAMLTLVEDKQKLCDRWSFEYRKEDWPAHGLFPAYFFGDRGSDVISKASDNVVEGVETGFVNSGPRKPVKKGTVECGFKLFHVSLKDAYGGYTPPSEFGKRQISDHSEDAVLTLDALGYQLLCFVRSHNHKVHRNMRRPNGDVFKGRLAIPIDIWNRDSAERMGMLTAFDSDYLRFKLLPKAKATVTRNGILFEGLLYSCERALSEEWLLVGGRKSFEVDVTYDRRLVDAIYVHDKRSPSKWETATLTDSCLQHGGLSFAEWEAFKHARTKLGYLGEEHNLARELNDDADAEARNREATKLMRRARAASNGKAPKTGGKVKRDIESQQRRQTVTVLPSKGYAGSAPPTPTARVSATAPISSINPSHLPQAVTGANTTANAAFQALLRLKKS